MISIDEIRGAAARIAPLIHRTPVMRSRLFDERAGRQCFFKCENLQRGGAFKIRGAANFLLSLTPEERKRGVVAFSSGNHAQAVAIAAAATGTRATIAMPTDAPASKLAATIDYGASVVHYNRHTDDREAVASKLAAETGAIVVPPFDHEWIMAGQGTAALELFEEVPDLDAVVACVGGGGLLSGTAVAAKGTRPEIGVFGAEPEQANDVFLSFQKRERVAIAPPDTIADGLRPTMPGALTFPLILEHAEAIITVSEPEIRDTVQFIASRLKIVVEPSGAVSAAPALFGKLPPGARRVGIMLSGGNV
ncbi:MAG TPA: pyridoxal-phosphate dependent enzyme [Bryobacteraceae bacterium]|nr:pyridoxal-phosphate dependent enzyme [Bryobacteraceae bacterium]